MILKTFKQVNQKYNARTLATGTTKDLVADYTKFFFLMKEKDITSFLAQVFDMQAYNQVLPPNHADNNRICTNWSPV